jgi:uncharacterized protein YlxW (UPF0749 family)
MTDNEIIKALECFAIDKDFDETHCIGCAFEHQFCTANMSEDIAIPALDLINRQKVEIEALINGQETLQKYIAEQKAEIERLQKLYNGADNCIDELEYALDKVGHSNSRVDEALEDYRNLVKEMVGDVDGKVDS